MPPLRIGVNALYLIPGGVGGTEIYLRSLLTGLAAVDATNEYFIFANEETDAGLAPPAPNFHLVRTPVRAVNRPARIIWEQLRLPAAVHRERIDVLFNPGFTAPASCRCPAVTVFHDLQHKRHPEYFRRWDLPFWNLFLGQSARTSKRLIAVSRATAADLELFYPGTAEKTRVVYHGVDERLRAIRPRRAPERFLLCVSTLHPHKNLDRLVRVYASFRRSFPDYTLVLAGMKGFHTGPVERLVETLGLTGSLRITGWIPREELYDLYRRAWAFVYPSTFEGFGMPVLEALAAGLPVACSSIAPLAEVAGGCAVVFDPEDERGMLAALSEVTADAGVRARLSAGGAARAEGFSWAKCARETLGVLQETADNVPASG